MYSIEIYYIYKYTLHIYTIYILYILYIYIYFCWNVVLVSKQLTSWRPNKERMVQKLKINPVSTFAPKHPVQYPPPSAFPNLPLSQPSLPLTTLSLGSLEYLPFFKHLCPFAHSISVPQAALEPACCLKNSYRLVSQSVFMQNSHFNFLINF